MKLAILGSGPIALEAALQFHSIDASLTWFNPEFPCLREKLTGSWDESTTEAGRRVVKQDFKATPFTWDTWKTLYYFPLVEFLKTSGQQVKPLSVLSVTKRFLASDEEVEGSTRFADLFRIIYQLNPEEFINQQKESDPETYKRLSEEFIQSLQSSLEMYEDFDLVMDLREPNKSTSIAVTGRALGEGRVSKDKILYGLDSLDEASKITPTPELREICLVGDGELAAEVLLRLESWLKEPRSRLFVVSHHADPFSEFRKLDSLFADHEREFKQETVEFQKKLRDWQELDDFVQVKIPKPAEPIPRLVFFSGHNVTAVDELIDRRRVFVTIEKPEFRQGLKQPENNYLDLKTVGVDLVLAANNLRKDDVTQYLRHNEKGHFVHMPKKWKEDLHALEAIKDEIFKLFSPVSHTS